MLGVEEAVLAAPDLSLTTATAIPRGSDHDPERPDFAAALSDLIAKRDFEFAIKKLADYASASLKAGRPLLQRSPKPKDPEWAAALAGVTIYTAHHLDQTARLGQNASSPSKMHACLPAEPYRSIREPMKQLTESETPHELAAMNDFIRERSLA